MLVQYKNVRLFACRLDHVPGFLFSSLPRGRRPPRRQHLQFFASTCLNLNSHCCNAPYILPTCLLKIEYVVYLRGKGCPQANNLQGNFPLHPFSTILPVKAKTSLRKQEKATVFVQGGSMQCNAALTNVRKCLGRYSARFQRGALAGAISLRIGNK